MSVNFIRNCDKRTKFFTGLTAFFLFTTVFEFVARQVQKWEDLRWMSSWWNCVLSLLNEDLRYKFGVSVSFISKYWDGRVSDKEELTQQSVFRQAGANRWIMADCSFLIEEVALQRVKLIIPAFTKFMCLQLEIMLSITAMSGNKGMCMNTSYTQDNTNTRLPF